VRRFFRPLLIAVAPRDLSALNFVQLSFTDVHTFDERCEAFCFAIFGNHDLHGDDWKPHGAWLFTRSANLRLFVAPFCNLRLFEPLLCSRTLISTVCSVSESQKGSTEARKQYFSVYRLRPASRFETRQRLTVLDSRNRIQRGRLVPPW
jgi:hypothetical protein